MFARRLRVEEPPHIVQARAEAHGPNHNSEVDIDELIPLTDSQFYILWALADGAHHGYAMIHYFEHHESVRAKIGPGTINRNLLPMVALGLIEKTDTSEPQPRGKKYYRITEKGRQTLLAHLQFMEEEIELAKAAAEELEEENW